MTNLIERLRTSALPENWGITNYALCIEAADRIAALEAENRQLEIYSINLRAMLEAVIEADAAREALK